MSPKKLIAQEASMYQRRQWTAIFVLALVLGVPRMSTAGLWDVIIEMSGPRMFGVSGDCRLTLQGVWESCKASIATARDFLLRERSPDAKRWLTFGAGYYFSAAKTINDHDFDYFDVNMVTFDPMFEMESRSSKVEYSKLRLQIYHGIVGATFNVLFVRGDPPTFVNGGLKFRPAGVVVPVGDNWGVDLAYDLRLYPSGFTAEDFGFPARDDDGGFEAVHAFVVGIRWKLGDQ
jgi:hypothetical protein